MQIRKASRSDFEFIFPLLKEAFSSGDTYLFTGEFSKQELYDAWMENTQCVYVAVDDGKIQGTYYIKPNHPGRGSHICNAGYIVGSSARGKGIGKEMCMHSLDEAKKLGYRGMQYNLVASTNQTAVKLWESCGFEIVGTIPRAFDHKELGYVDAYVMYKHL